MTTNLSLNGVCLDGPWQGKIVEGDGLKIPVRLKKNLAEIAGFYVWRGGHWEWELIEKPGAPNT